MDNSKQKLKILLVDNDKLSIMLIKAFLIRMNLNIIIVEAIDGQDGLNKFKSIDDIDMIITDLDMPIMDGLEMIEEIKSINDKILCICATSHNSSDVSLKFDYILQKPLKKDDLKKAVFYLILKRK